jgi:F-type H+-transporting ATPase subunit a
LNFTLALALTVVISVNVIGTAAVGFKGHMSKYFNFKSPVGFFVGLLELLGEFSRAISFAFRLFGNIFAGEVLLIIMGFLAPFLAPVPFLGLEIFVGFVQALVFTMLTMVFISIAIEHHT